MPSNVINIRWGLVMGIACLLLATVFAYENSTQGSFHSDDYIVIQNNPDIGNAYGLFSFPPRYRLWLHESFSLNYRQGGLDPSGYHRVNICLHLLTGMVIALLTGLTLRWNGHKGTNCNQPAMLAGALFLLHPVHTETVTYISGRSSGQSALLFLLALFGFALSQRKPLPVVLRTGAGLVALVSSYGAVLTKETCVVLPLAFFLFDYCFMRDSEWVPCSRRLKYIYGPLFSGAILLLVSSPTFRIQITHWMDKVDWSLPWMQAPVLLHGLKLLAFPFNLTFDYDFSQARYLTGTFQILAIIFWLSMIFFAWRWRRQELPLFTFAVFWFLLVLSPTNSILPRMDLFSERNLYLASIGFIWWGGVLLHRGITRWWGRPLSPVVTSSLIFLLLGFGLLTHDRNEIYRSDISLWRDTRTKSPNKSEVHYYLAMSHYFAGDMENARMELARLTQKDPNLVQTALAETTSSQKQLESYLKLLADLKQVVQSDPKQFKLYGRIYRELANLFRSDRSLYFTRLLLGARHAGTGNLQMAEAEFRKAQLEKPHLPHAFLDLASLYARMGRFDQAVQAFTEAELKIQLAPELKPSLHLQRGRLYLSQNRRQQAKMDLLQGLEESDQKGKARLLLGQLFKGEGKTQEAIAQWEQVGDTLQQKVEARFLIAMAFIEGGQFSKGQAAFEEVVQLNPEHLPARFNLAKLILDQGQDPEAALEHLKFIQRRTREPEKLKMVQNLLARIPDGNETH